MTALGILSGLWNPTGLSNREHVIYMKHDLHIRNCVIFSHKIGAER